MASTGDALEPARPSADLRYLSITLYIALRCLVFIASQVDGRQRNHLAIGKPAKPTAYLVLSQPAFHGEAGRTKSEIGDRSHGQPYPNRPARDNRHKREQTPYGPNRRTLKEMGNPTRTIWTRRPWTKPRYWYGPVACRAESGSTIRLIVSSTAMPKNNPHTSAC